VASRPIPTATGLASLDDQPQCDYRGFNMEGQLVNTVKRVVCWPSGLMTRNR